MRGFDPFDPFDKAMEKPVRLMVSIYIVIGAGLIGYGIYETIKTATPQDLYTYVLALVAFAIGAVLVGAVYLILGRKRK